MSELHYIYNREKHMTARALIHTYGSSLPMLFVVCNGYIYQEDIDFPSEQLLLIFSIGYQERALVHDANGRTLSIPVDYRHRFNVLSHNKDKDLTLRQVADKYNFPVVLEISKPETLYFSDNSAASFKSLKVMDIHVHPYLKAVTVNGGTFTPCMFPVPLYLKYVTFCRVTGLDTTNKAEDSSRALKTLMDRLTAQLHKMNFSEECADEEIIMLSDKRIIDMKHFYDKVTENIYIRIGLKNSNEPKYKHMIPQRRLPPIPAGELEEEVPNRPPRTLKQNTPIAGRELPPTPCQKLSPHKKESAVKSMDGISGLTHSTSASSLWKKGGQMTSEETCRVNEVSMSHSLHLSGENREKPNTEDTFYKHPPAEYDVEILPTDLFRKQNPSSGFFQGHSTSGRLHRDNSQSDHLQRETVSPSVLQKEGKLQYLSRESIGTAQGSGAVISSNSNASLPSDTVFLKEKIKSDISSPRQSNIASSMSTNRNEKEKVMVKPMPPDFTTRHSSPALIPSHHNPAPGLTKMTVNDVGELLHRLFLEKHELNFRKNLVDGVILSKITDEILYKEFGFSELETLRLRTFIESGHIPK